ncbi:MAG: hypothetical protein M1830_005147 [Pleopsidium flavum]|nr:MAG: hypothetical protein M1830_005147 [Pleopsidium flavum]
MGAYYENAQITIAATGASNSNEGCFLPRPAISDPVKLPYSTESGEYAGEMCIQPLGQFVDTDPTLGPLSSRAWLVCQCNTLSQREDGNEAGDELKKWTSWRFIVHEYSRRSLTHVTDRLIALQGMANVIQNIIKHQYLQGLWAENLAEQLLWSVGVYGTGNRNGISTRPDELQEEMPSWSWCSTLGQVDIRSKNDKAIMVCGDILFFPPHHLKLHSRIKEIPQFEGQLFYTIHYDYDLPLQDVPIVSNAAEKAKVYEAGGFVYHQLFTMCDESKKRFGYASADGYEIPSGPTYCLPILANCDPVIPRSEKVRRDHQALLLTPVPNEHNVYRCFGTATITESSWLDDAPKHKITIV